MASPVVLNSQQSSSSLSNSAIRELSQTSELSSSSLNYSHVINSELVVEDAEIPEIDFSLLIGGTPDQRSQAVEDLWRACEEWGFFALVNHGVPERLRKAMMDTLKGFFDLSEENKLDYADTHVMNPIRYGTSFNPKVDDVKYWRDYLKLITHPEFHCPTSPPEFREILQEYTRSTRELGRKLLGGIWDSLGVDVKYMNEALNLDSCFQIVVGNLYRPCPQPELAMGLPPHSDHGLLTILYQNEVNGLELKHNGKWVRVKPLPESYLINTGDHMEIVSNGKYKSVLHRAVADRWHTRMSIAAVVNPSFDTVVVPAEQLLSNENPVAFRGMKYGEFLEYQQSTRLKDKSVLDLLRL